MNPCQHAIVTYLAGAAVTCAWTRHARARDPHLQKLWSDTTRWATDALFWFLIALFWPVMLLDLVDERIIRRWRKP